MENQGLYHTVISYLSALTCGASHLFWPGRCLVCAESIVPSDDRLCQTCWYDLSKAVSADYCRRCGRSVSPYGIVNGQCGHCQDAEYAFDGLIRAGEYENALRSLILAFKFREKTELSNRLGSMLKLAFESQQQDLTIEMIAPVPLHWRRKLQRGYNQAHLLSRIISAKRIPVSTDLVRVRNTEQQWNLTGPQRRRNVKGAFAVRKDHAFEGKTIALIDDITTSGATLNECAKVLKEAGAGQVIAVVLATAYHDE
jgi:ComF family protein